MTSKSSDHFNWLSSNKRKVYVPAVLSVNDAAGSSISSASPDPDTDGNGAKTRSLSGDTSSALTLTVDLASAFNMNAHESDASTGIRATGNTRSIDVNIRIIVPSVPTSTD